MILSYDSQLSLGELVRYYYGIKPKLKYKEIVTIINKHHDKYLTLRTFKRICEQESLTRKCNVTYEDLGAIVRNELCTSMSLVGYRQMAENITFKYNVNVSKEAVRLALRENDPVGVENRRQRTIKRRVYNTDGPGDVYHIDGNDKLKKWGFAIHGGVDGFSRKILWLTVCTTNNDPLVVVNLFLDCIKTHKLVPKLLRMDNGTENVYCKDLQSFFTGSDESFLCSVSVRNQRIEAFWSRLKKYRLSWWMKLFTGMEKNGLYNPNFEVHRELLIFCFMPPLQAELNDLVKTWNIRHIRQSSEGPAGKPDILFNVPSTVGYSHKGIPVSDQDVNVAHDLLAIDKLPCWKNEDLFELFLIYMAENELQSGRSVDDALDLYTTILECLIDDDLLF